MKRRHCFLLTFIFLSGLIGLDWQLFCRPENLQRISKDELQALLKVPFSHAPIKINIATAEVEIRDIRIMDGYNSDREFLSCQTLIARLDVWKLLQGELQLGEVVVKGPELHLRWKPDGELSLPSIFQPTETGESRMSAPTVKVEDMNVVFHKAPFWGTDEVAISGIKLTVSPTLASKTYPFFLEGAIEDPTFGIFDIDAKFGGAPLQGTIKRPKFALVDEHLKYLQSSLQSELRKVKMANGEIDLTVEFFAKDILDRIDYTIQAEMRDVQLSYDDWPFSVAGMQGRLRFSDLKVESEGIDFQIADAPVAVSELKVDFTGSEPGFDMKAFIDHLNIDERLIADLKQLPEPFIEVGESMEALGARGRIDVHLDLSKVAAPGRVEVDILATFRDAHLAYIGFLEEDGTREGYPYPLEKVVGEVHIKNDELTFKDLSSSAKTPSLVAAGRITYGRLPFSYDIDIKGYDIHLDDKVRMTLPPEERGIYDSYEPEGPIDFDLSIVMPAGREDESPDVLLEVALKGCQVLPRLFPYQLSDLNGQLVFGKAGGTEINGVQARNGRARFTVNGRLDHSSATEDPTFSLDIEVEDLAVDEQLMKGLGAEFRDIATELRRYNFDGDVDFKCQIKSEGEGALNTYAADLKGLSFRYEEFPNALGTELWGRVTAQGDRLQIEEADFKLGGCDIAATGWVNIGSTEGHELNFECPKLVISKNTLDIANDAAPFITDLREAMDLHGSVSLGLTMRKGPRGELVRTSITAQGLRIKLHEPSLVFEDVYGSLKIEGDDLNFEGWTAALPYGLGPEDPDRLILNINKGRWRSTEDGDFLNIHEVGFRDLMLDERLFRRLPDSWAATMRDWKLKGRFAGRMTSFRYSNEMASFHGTLLPSEITLDPGVPIELNHGNIVIEDASFDADGFDIKGSLVDSDLTVLDFPINHAKALFQVDQRSVAIRELSGDCFGGRVNPTETYFVMDHGTDGRFETSASLSEIDLSQWMASRGGDPKSVLGRATAWARMAGFIADDATYEGSGELWVSGRRLYDLPLLATVLQVLNLDFLANDEIQTAHCKAEIGKSKVRMKNVRFDGPGVRLRGDGEIGFDGIVRLSFNPTIIKLLDPIPLIGDLVNAVTGFVVNEIRITGPLEDLRAETDNYLTGMLPSEEDSGRRLKPRDIEPEKEK